MKNDDSRRIPPPPLFTIRPPPKPPGLLFDDFQTVEIFNGQCVRLPLNILDFSSSSSTVLGKQYETNNWLNSLLRVFAASSIIFCIIITIFIFICLKKLKKEEKQYKQCVMSASSTSRSYEQHHQTDEFTGTNEHYKCTSSAFHCCEDYYSHQIVPMKDSSSHCILKSTDALQRSVIGTVNYDQDTPQNHQYECIPEYLLTMTRHHQSPIVYHHPHQLCHHMNARCCVSCSTLSRSYLVPQGLATATTATTESIDDSNQCTCSALSPVLPIADVQEEVSMPLITSMMSKEPHTTGENMSAKSLMVGWTRRKASSSIRCKSDEHQYSFLSQLRKSSIL